MKKLFLKKDADYYWALLAILPVLIFFTMFLLYPQVINLRYSFTNYDGFSSNYSYIGLENFARFFSQADPKGMISFKNTLKFSFFALLIGVPLQLVLALIFYNGVKGESFFKGLLYIPAVISLVIISVGWNDILQYRGLLNRILELIGLTPYDWLGSTKTALGCFIFINAWQFTGYGTIIYLAGLNSIPSELLESASIDGAVGFRKFVYITLPLMMHSITIALFMGLTGSLQMFVLPFIMTGGGPLDSTLTFAMNIYNNAFKFQRFGYAGAMAILFTLFIGTISLIQMHITRKREVDY